MSTRFPVVELLGDNIPWLHDFRQAGRNNFNNLGIPNAKTEAWKYTKPNMFLDHDFVCESKGKIVDYLPNLPFKAYKICFINGVFSPSVSNLPEGIEIFPLIEAIMLHPEAREKIGSLAKSDKYPFAALNGAYLNEGIYIHLSKGIKLDTPLAIINFVETDDTYQLFNLRNILVLDEGSSAELIEYYHYRGALKSLYFNNVVNEIYIGENANLNHYKIQDEAFKAIHIGLNCVAVHQDGSYKSFCLQKGADLARNETQVLLEENGAKAEVDGAYLMNGWATLDITTDIKHLASETYSDQLVKGVVGGQAKGVFQGCIHIAPHAIKTKGNQQHRALLLSDDAEVDVKPELEIYADDVQCSHGSACGQLDAEQLFYMRSRGLSEEDAKKILIDAYINEVIAKVDNEKVVEWIKLLLEQQ